MKKILKNEEIPVDFQIDVFNKEELNDDDCVFFCLLDNLIHHPDFGDTIIRLDNSGLSSTVKYRYSMEFIRESLGRLEHEGMIKVQFLHHPPTGNRWREISITSGAFKTKYFQDWLMRHKEKLEIVKTGEINKTGKFITIEEVPINLGFDIYNEEPLSDDDYLVLSILLNVEEQSIKKICTVRNSTLSQLSKSRYSDKFIYQSLGKLEREGIIRVAIYVVPPSYLFFREIIIVEGFSQHKGVQEWVSKLQKKSA